MLIEVFSAVAAQEKDTGGYEVSKLKEKQFYWQILQLDMYAVFRPEKNHLFNSFWRPAGGSAVQVKRKECSPHTNPVSN